MMANTNQNKRTFSKNLLVQESVIVWIMSILAVYLAYVSITTGNSAALPYIIALIGFPWSAYGVSQAYYYKKSLAENTAGGIVFETAMKEIGNKITNPVIKGAIEDGIDVFNKVTNVIKDSNQGSSTDLKNLIVAKDERGTTTLDQELDPYGPI